MVPFELPLSEIEFTFVRSSGPGGQNVNKVNSKAVARWNIAESNGLAPQIKEKLLARLAARLTRGGELLVSSDQTRDQQRNREHCIEKIQAIIAQGLFEPKKRKKTKISFSQKQKKTRLKKSHSMKKKFRQKPKIPY